MTVKFQGNTALVIGGANGIGAAICRRYATEGGGAEALVFTSMPTVTLLRDALIERNSVSKGSPPSRLKWHGRNITRRESMTKLLAVCFIALFAGFAIQTSVREKQALRLVQTIPLPGVKGRLDHMGVDLDKKRLFVAAVANNTLEVVDLTGGEGVARFFGLKENQEALFFCGGFKKIYFFSLDRHARDFRRSPLRPGQDISIKPC